MIALWLKVELKLKLNLVCNEASPAFPEGAHMPPTVGRRELEILEKCGQQQTHIGSQQTNVDFRGIINFMFDYNFFQLLYFT